MKVFWRSCVVLGLSSLVCSCLSSDDDTDQSTPLPDHAGLAVVAVASDYSSSNLYYQPFKDGIPADELKTILTGESGDPWLKRLGSALYLFNRTSTNSNFRKLDPKSDRSTDGTQIRSEGAGIGDPHAAILLSSDRLLLAHYTAGKVVVVNPTDGSLVQEVSADWDLGSDPLKILRPEAFYRAAEGSSDIYLVHQGRNSDFSGFTQSQQLFLLRDDGKSISVVDLNGDVEKVQGIKLHVYNPQVIDGSKDPLKPIIGGFCTIYDTASPCTSGFEVVDLAGKTSTLTYDLSTSERKGNGSVVAGGNGKFFGVLAKSDGQSGYVSQVVEFDPLAASSADIYAIKDANYAAYAIAVDQVAKRLYIGEKKDDGTGQFAILKVDALTEAPTTLSLPLPPYGVEFVP